LWIERQLSLEREMACDDQVLAETANPRGYAKCLIALLEKSAARRGWAMAQAAVHRAREASLRLAQILDQSRPNTKHVWKPALGFVGAFAFACLMVVPRAPQFVAFEPNTRAAQAALLSQSHIPVAAVIPASIRTQSSSSLKKVPQPTAAQAVAHASKHPSMNEDRTAAPRVIAVSQSASSQSAASQKTTAGSSPVEIVTVRSNQSDASASETLLIIRTTQQVGPNAWVWSVGVWRVTLLNPAQDAAPKAPAAKKT
jgi:hypothetical protein